MCGRERGQHHSSAQGLEFHWVVRGGAVSDSYSKYACINSSPRFLASRPHHVISIQSAIFSNQTLAASATHVHESCLESNYQNECEYKTLLTCCSFRPVRPISNFGVKVARVSARHHLAPSRTPSPLRQLGRGGGRLRGFGKRSRWRAAPVARALSGPVHRGHIGAAAALDRLPAPHGGFGEGAPHGARGQHLRRREGRPG